MMDCITSHQVTQMVMVMMMMMMIMMMMIMIMIIIVIIIIIIRDNKQGTCMLIDITIPGD